MVFLLFVVSLSISLSLLLSAVLLSFGTSQAAESGTRAQI